MKRPSSAQVWVLRSARVAVFAAGAGTLASSCGLAGRATTTGGFGGNGGAPPTASSTSTSSGVGGFVGPGAGGGAAGATSSSTSTGGATGGSGGAGTGGGAGGTAANCTPSEGAACCENDVACVGQPCCLHPDGSGLSCETMCNAGLQPVGCETNADCPSLSMPMCCAHWHHGSPAFFDGLACKMVCAPPANATKDGDYQACDVGADDCFVGQCVADSKLGGARHGYCKP